MIIVRSYIAHNTSKWRLYALEALLPQIEPSCSLSALRAFEGINSCWVPIYYTWVERDNNGQYALSKGVRTEWDSNPRDLLIASRECKPLHHSAPRCRLNADARWRNERKLFFWGGGGGGRADDQISAVLKTSVPASAPKQIYVHVSKGDIDLWTKTKPITKMVYMLTSLR